MTSLLSRAAGPPRQPDHDHDDHDDDIDNDDDSDDDNDDNDNDNDNDDDIKNTAKLYGDALVYPQSLLIN